MDVLDGGVDAASFCSFYIPVLIPYIWRYSTCLCCYPGLRNPFISAIPSSSQAINHHSSTHLLISAVARSTSRRVRTTYAFNFETSHDPDIPIESPMYVQRPDMPPAPGDRPAHGINDYVTGGRTKVDRLAGILAKGLARHVIPQLIPLPTRLGEYSRQGMMSRLAIPG